MELVPQVVESGEELEPVVCVEFGEELELVLCGNSAWPLCELVLVEVLEPLEVPVEPLDVPVEPLDVESAVLVVAPPPA